MAGKVVKQLAGSGTGQSLKDRVNAAKYILSGSGLGRAVCKATTEEIAVPKRKHLEYLIMCTHEPNISIPELADQLIARCQSGSWVVSFKAFITLHKLMNSGNDRFSQYLASNNCELAMRNFTDKTTVQGYDMSIFVRKYSCYINEKADSYREMAFDFCKVKRGKDGILRVMSADKLLKALPILQRQVDALLEFEATPNELTNRVIICAFLLLYKDLIRLFASYNEAMINLFDKYFTAMSKKQCRDALQLYKNYIQRSDKVNSFFKTAEVMGFGDSDVFALQPVTTTLLESLEAHLSYMENNKGVKPPGGGGTAPGNLSLQATSQKGSSQRETPTGVDIGSVLQDAGKISEAERRKIIEEESQRLAQFANARRSSLGQNSFPKLSESSGVNGHGNTSTASGTIQHKKTPPSADLLDLLDDFNPSTGWSSTSSATTANFTNASPFSSGLSTSFNPFETPIQPSPILPLNLTPSNSMQVTNSHLSQDMFAQKPSAPASNAAPVVAPKPSTKPLSADVNLDENLASLAGSLTLTGPGAGYKWGASSTGPTGPQLSSMKPNVGGGSTNWIASGPSFTSPMNGPTNQGIAMSQTPFWPTYYPQPSANWGGMPLQNQGMSWPTVQQSQFPSSPFATSGVSQTPWQNSFPGNNTNPFCVNTSSGSNNSAAPVNDPFGAI